MSDKSNKGSGNAPKSGNTLNQPQQKAINSKTGQTRPEAKGKNNSNK